MCVFILSLDLKCVVTDTQWINEEPQQRISLNDATIASQLVAVLMLPCIVFFIVPMHSIEPLSMWFNEMKWNEMTLNNNMNQIFNVHHRFKLNCLETLSVYYRSAFVVRSFICSSLMRWIWLIGAFVEIICQLGIINQLSSRHTSPNEPNIRFHVASYLGILSKIWTQTSTHRTRIECFRFAQYFINLCCTVES